MPVPATKGQLRERIEDMKIGDYIVWGYVGSNKYVMGNSSTEGFTEIPLNGVAAGSGVLNNRFWYGVKVDKGLIVSDRVIIHSRRWSEMNDSRVVQGRNETIGDVNGILRSLTGGCAYADENGNLSLTDKGFGAFPTNNEWDKYIVNFPQELIQEGKTLDDVFHCQTVNLGTWCQDTPINNVVHPNELTLLADNTFRVWRGYTQHNSVSISLQEKMFGFAPTTYTSATVGFRPVFEFSEV